MAGDVITLRLRPLTSERRDETIALLERASHRAAAMRQARGGRPFDSSADDVRAIRDAAEEGEDV